MVTNISSDLGLESEAINIKAKTNEGLGYLGRKEGIAANVVVLLGRAAVDDSKVDWPKYANG